MYKTMFSTVVAMLTLLLCLCPGDVAACTWVLWKEVVEGRDIVRPEQPWFLVKTFSNREASGQRLRASVEALKSATLPPRRADVFIEEEQGGVLVDDPIGHRNISTRFLCLPDTLDPHKVVHP